MDKPTIFQENKNHKLLRLRIVISERFRDVKNAIEILIIKKEARNLVLRK